MNYSLSVFSIFVKFFDVTESNDLQSNGYIRKSLTRSIGFYRLAFKDEMKNVEKRQKTQLKIKILFKAIKWAWFFTWMSHQRNQRMHATVVHNVHNCKVDVNGVIDCLFVCLFVCACSLRYWEYFGAYEKRRWRPWSQKELQFPLLLPQEESVATKDPIVSWWKVRGSPFRKTHNRKGTI